MSITRAFICLLLFTGISYAVNHKLGGSDNFLFAVAQVKTTKIEAKVTDAALFRKVIGRAIAPFVAAALEHVAIGRAFGMRNNYVTGENEKGAGEGPKEGERLISQTRRLAGAYLPRFGQFCQQLLPFYGCWWCHVPDCGQ